MSRREIHFYPRLKYDIHFVNYLSRELLYRVYNEMYYHREIFHYHLYMNDFYWCRLLYRLKMNFRDLQLWN